MLRETLDDVLESTGLFPEQIEVDHVENFRLSMSAISIMVSIVTIQKRLPKSILIMRVTIRVLRFVAGVWLLKATLIVMSTILLSKTGSGASHLHHNV